MRSAAAAMVDPRWAAVSTVDHVPARWAVLRLSGRVWSTVPVLSVRAYTEDPGPAATWFMGDRELFPVSGLHRDLAAFPGAQIVLVEGTATLLPGGRMTQRTWRIPAPGDWCPWLSLAVERAGCVWTPGMEMVAGGHRRAIEDRSQLKLWLD